MQNLKVALQSKLKNARKIAVLGIGSELRGDDACGMLIAKELQNSCNNNGHKELKVFLGATAPENLTGEIKRFKPTHLIVIDSVDIGIKPGAITLFKPEEEFGNFSSTHRLPIRMLIEYLLKFFECEVIFIGIKPKVIDFCCSISKEVEKSVKYIADTVKEILK